MFDCRMKAASSHMPTPGENAQVPAAPGHTPTPGGSAAGVPEGTP